MKKYRFTGFIEYAPKNEREWYFKRTTFTKEIESKSKEMAEIKLQRIMFANVTVPAKRVNFEYKCEVINEVD